jgi:hypothetical protein
MVHLKIFTIITAVFMATVGYGQIPGEGKEETVLGADNISSVVKSSLNAIPNLRVGSVTGNFVYKATFLFRKDENTYAYSYVAFGKLSIDDVTITMSDGEMVTFKQEDSELKTYHKLFVQSGYSGYELAIPVSIDGTSSVDGKNSSFTYLSLPTSTMRDETDKRVPIGSFEHSLGGKYININCTGLTQQSITNIKSSIERVRKKYDQLKKSQQDRQNYQNSGNNSSSSSSLTLASEGNSSSSGSSNSTSNQGFQSSNEQNNSTNTSSSLTLASEGNSSSSGSSNSSSNNTTNSNTSSSNKKTSDDKTETNTNSNVPKATYTDPRTGTELTYEQLEFQRRQYQQRERERIANAVNPVGQIMKESGLNDYFQREMDRIDREYEEKSAALDRKLAQQKREREAEERERKRQQEERSKRLIASHNASEQQRRQEYEKKGGDANYSRNYQHWEIKAKNSITQVNDYLSKYKGKVVSFSVPANNCQYVEVIENIQNSSMPISYKSILIANVLTVRTAYNTNYQENGFITQTDGEYNGGPYSDNLTWSDYYDECGNYLDHIDEVLNGRASIYRNFGKDREWTIKNKYDRYDNYSHIIGRYNQFQGINTSFIDEVRKAGISVHTSRLDFGYYNDMENRVIKNFHNEPRVWSEGYGYSTDKKMLYFSSNGNPAIEAEIKKFETLYELKRKYAINRVEDELEMAFFTYHTDNIDEAYKHFLRYSFMRSNGIDKKELWYYIWNDEFSNYDTYTKELEAALLGIVLYLEKQAYRQALHLIQLLELSNNKSKRDWNSYSKSRVNEAVIKLKNQLYYRTGEYHKMTLIKDKNELKQLVKKSKEKTGESTYIMFQDLPIQAHALIKLGNPDLAKALYGRYEKYYYHKKNKSFQGETIALKAFHETNKALFPKKNINITSSTIETYNIFPGWYYESNLQMDGRFLTKNKMSWLGRGKNTRLTIDLSTDEEYKKQKEDFNKEFMNADPSSVKDMVAIWNNVFLHLQKTYNRGTIVNNEEGKLFLHSYIHAGVLLGKFHEVMPAMMEFDLYYPGIGHHLALESNLLKLMWEYNGNPLYENRSNYSSSPLKNYFDNEIQKNSSNITKLKNILDYWSYLKISSPMIPYLYKVIENNE